MTSPEAQGGTNPKKENLTCLTQTQLAGLAAAAALVGVALGYAAHLALAPDPDRPPIIVRNGSVLFEVALPGGDNQKGKFVPKDVNRKIWFHDLTGRPTTNLAISVSGADPTAANPCSATPYFFAQNVIDATINYVYSVDETDGTTTNKRGKIALTVPSGDLQIDLDADGTASQTTGEEFRLKVDAGKGATMRSILLRFTNFAGDENSVTCTFGTSIPAEIAVLQRRN